MMYTEKQKDEFKLKFIQTRRYQVPCLCRWSARAKYLGKGLSPNHCPKCGVALSSQ